MLNYPVVSGMTLTAGNVVFFGDVGGNFYALDGTTGEELWTTEIDGGIGGGVITYMAGGAQKVTVAAGFISPVIFAGMNNFQTVFADARELDYADFFFAYTVTVAAFRLVLARFKGGTNELWLNLGDAA